jgi:quercetin dioxygenase-like cupin family protein
VKRREIAFFRNIDSARPVTLAAIADCRDNRIISRSILNRTSISMVIFAMDLGEEISEETEPETGWFRVLEGTLQVEIGNEGFAVGQGNDIVIPANEIHTLKALKRCKYLQISIREDSDMEQGTFIKKVPVRQVVRLSELIEYESHKISSISLVQKKDLIINLFASDMDEEMGGHANTGDAMVHILEGTAEITIGDESFTLEAGQSIIMPANVQHSLKAVKAYKMLLTVVKP